jgi:hypothetical protein
MSSPTAHKTMLELWVLRLVDKDNPDDINSVQRISLRPEFTWFISDEFKRLREIGRKGGQACISTDGEQKEKIPLVVKIFYHLTGSLYQTKALPFGKSITS